MIEHKNRETLTALLPNLDAAPKDVGRVEMIVSRPVSGQRAVLENATVSAAGGLQGDRWVNGHDPDHEAQLTLMSSRAIDLIAGARDNWAAAGDNLFVDLDLSVENLPAGSRLAIGSAEIEISAIPHTGCDKFIDRFGRDACVWVNTGPGRTLRLRGANARVIRDGNVAQGDSIRKI